MARETAHHATPEAGREATAASGRLAWRRPIHRRLRRGDPPPASQGFIAMVLLVLLTLVLGSLTISSRTTSGNLTTAAQGRNREARDVAEAGTVEIMSELNKERNRKILVSGVSLDSWQQGLASMTNPLVNPCTRYASDGSLQAVSTPSERAVNLRLGWQDLVSGDSSRQYRLVSVNYSDTKRATAFASTPIEVRTGQVKALIRLTVEGRVRDGRGNLLSTSRIVKEYEVVPKCCKRSFGRNSFAATNFGEDNRFCFSGGTAAVIGGLNGGEIISSNNKITIVNENGVPVTRVLCSTTVPAPGSPDPDCVNGTMTLGLISVVPSSFTITMPAWPGGDSIPFTSIAAPAITYLRVNNATAGSELVEACKISNNNRLTDCNAVSACTKITAVPDYIDGHYCRFSSINAGNGQISIDTSNSPIFIYFDTPTAPRSSGQYMDYNGNGLVRHVTCSPGVSNIPCNTTALLPQIERLNLYAYGTGAFRMNGSSATITVNIFAPKASFEILGGGNAEYNFIGRLWLDTIRVTGSTDLQVSESSPGQFCPDEICPPGSTPEVDWVARSVTYSSAF